MAFLKKKNILPVILVRIIAFLLLFGAFSGAVYFLYQRQIKEMKKLHEDEIESFRFQLYELERQTLVPKEDIPFGTVLSMEQFNKVGMKLQFSQDVLLDESDMGKTSMMVLPKGIPVLKTAVVDEPPSEDLRKAEFNMFLLQTDQIRGDFVDIRIIFPNAENYIVLGKKQVKDIKPAENIIWLWLNEEEIHLISSAIIDAYIHPGTKLYATTYIQPEIQEAAIPYYPANPYVLDLMRKDPNILKKASDMLAREARAILESHLQTMAPDDVTKVSAGIEEEIAKTVETIKNEAADEAVMEMQEQQMRSGSEPVH